MIPEESSAPSNLDRFLHCTTPVVPSQFVSKTKIRNLNRLWHPWERDRIECFRLRDLWNCYDEWSAYGAGVPISLDNGETLVQYYVPYLSAIQIFTSNSSLSSLREETGIGDGEMRDAFSDSCSYESETEKLCRWDASSSEEGLAKDNVLHLNDRLGHHIYVQYFERSSPCGRVPLMHKINELARKHPALMTLRSVDLSPASWMAVAWYPIYHIPMGKTIKDLSTCFLTYHTLSSSFQDVESDDDVGCGERIGMRVRAFGLATYKMQGSVWLWGGRGSRNQQRLLSLLSVADSWLKQLRVQHHDFNYFTAMSHY